MEQTKTHSLFFKYLRWGISSVFVFLLLALGGGIATSYFYQDKIKAYALNELNKNLKTDVSIGENTEVSFLRKFPYTSVRLMDVFALEISSKPKRDTLFFFDDVFLQFNLIDVVRGNYNIRNIQVDNGFLRLKADKDGLTNYDIFKKSTGKPLQYSLKLEKVMFKDVTFNYANRNTDIDISGKTDELKISGNFSEKIYDSEILGRAILWNIDHKGNRLLTTKRIRVEGMVSVDNVLKQYVFKGSKVKLADLVLAISGRLVVKDKNTFLDLNMHGSEMNIGSILSLVPEKYKNDLAGYSSTGVFYFTGNVNGNLGPGRFPQIEGSFGIRNAEIAAKGKKIPWKTVNLTGFYTNGKQQSNETSRLEIKNYHAELGKGFVKGSFFVENFLSPTITLSCDAKVDLAYLKPYLPLDTFTSLTGNGLLEIECKSHLLKPWQISKQDLQNAAIKGKMVFKDVYFELKGNPHDFRDFDGTFHFKGNELVIEDFSGFVSESDFALNGYFRNLIPYALMENGGDLYMNATLSADRINLNDILTRLPKHRGSDTIADLKLPAKADIVLLLDLEEVKFRKFTAKNVSGNVTLKNQILDLNGINLETLGGEMALSGRMDGRQPRNLLVNGMTYIQNADVSRFFESFDNFGQEFITANNLKGNAGLKAIFSFPISPTLEINTEKLLAEADLNIENGELQNFAPLFKLSKFIDLDELKNIKFSSLRNTISISNKKISIPQMEVNNNLLNIKLEGTHTFDNTIDYHFNLKLSDLMAKRYSRATANEFGEEEDESGKTSVFVKMTGKASNPIFAYDMVSAKQKLKVDWKNEKRNIKTTLRNEFSRKLNDTVTKASTGQKPKLKLSWEESKQAENDDKPAILNANPSDRKVSEPKKKAFFSKPPNDKNPQAEEKVKVDWE